MPSRLPYPGLRPFHREESDIFFGREAQTDELLRRLGRQHFLAVVGGSGCGKSSLVSAGMEAALELGYLGGAGSRWRIASMRPGGSPISRLAAALFGESALASELGDPALQPLLEASLRRGPLGLLDVWREADVAAGTNFLLIVDQFEEIFRFKDGSSRDEAAAFVALLLATAARHDAPLYVVLTMRTDFLAQCAIFAGLPEALNDGQYLCPRLTREQRRTSIEGPARVFGADVEAPLVSHILNEIDPGPQTLPVLQHLLARMWGYRINHSQLGDASYSGEVLTLADYDAVGGLAEALNRHADEAYEQLSPERQTIAQKVFRRLCERRSNLVDLRSPARLRDIADATGAEIGELSEIIEVFRDPRYGFLTPPPPEPLKPDTMIDISHESLISGWKRLSEWVGMESISAQQYRFLAQAATRWKAGQGALWGSPDLETATAWRKGEQPTAAWAARYGGDFELAMRFLDESRRQFDQQRRSELHARKQRVRRRVALLALAGIGTLVGGALFLLGVYSWRYKWEYHADYANYTNHLGVPEGLGRLSPAQVSHRGLSYHIVRRGRRGPVISMEAIDSRRRCTPGHQYRNHLHASDVEARGDCRWEYAYDTHGRITSEHAKDARGKLIEIVLYITLGDGRIRQVYLRPNGSAVREEDGKATSVEVQEFTMGSGHELLLHYRKRNGQPGHGPDNAFGRRMSYDGQGRLYKLTSLDADDAPMTDDAGNATVVFEDYDGLGNPRRGTAQDWNGGITLVKDGYAIAQMVYDENGNITEESYLDAQGKPVVTRSGVSKMTYTRGAHGDIEWTRSWDVDGKPAIDLRTNCHAVRAWFDARGNQTAVACYDTNMNLGNVLDQGYAYVREAYDADDNLTKESYVDSHGVPMHRDGYSSMALDYENNRVKSKTFLDPAGRAVNNAAGYARVDMEYDRDGNTTSFSYFASDGRPTLTSGGYARIVSTYDADGYLLKWLYQGVDGKPVISGEGYAERQFAYDNAGYQRQESRFDEQGRPLADLQGSAAYRHEYTDLEHGRMTKHSERFDEAGVLVGRPHAEATASPLDDAGRGSAGPAQGLVGGSSQGWISTFDEHGRETERKYVDAAGEPVTGGEEQVAGWRATYDDYGQITSQEFLDPHGRLVRANKGYARVENRYDEHGNAIETAYYDAGHQKALHPDGYHRVVRTYDVLGRQRLVTFYDAAGQETKHKDGYGRYLREYDRVGRLIGQQIFAPGGAPTLLDGYFFEKRELDQWGRIVSIRYYGIDGTTPVRSTAGYHLERRRYDERGREVETALYDENDARVVGADGYAIRKAVFDLRGLEVEAMYFDDHEAPISPLVSFAGHYAREVRRYDPAGNVTIEEVYSGSGDDRILTQDGYWRAAYAYDRGRRVQMEYFDKSGNPVLSKKDLYAKKVSEYDPSGNLISESYFGVAGEPVVPIGTLGCHRIENRFNSRKQVTEAACYDERSRLKTCEYGYARLVHEYDERGNEVEVRAYDESDKLVAPAILGYAKMTHRYDANGDLLEEAFFNARGGLVAVGDPVVANRTARIEWTYDEQHRVVEERRFGADGKAARTPVSTMVWMATDQFDLRCARWRGVYPPGSDASVTRVVDYQCWDAAGKLVQVP